MNKEILRDILSLKMKMFDTVTELLPDLAKSKLHSLHNDIISSINEATSEYLNNNMSVKENKGVKSVSIE